MPLHSIDNMTIGEIRKALKNGTITKQQFNEYLQPLNEIFRSSSKNFAQSVFKSTFELISEGVKSLEDLLAPNIRGAVAALAKTGWFLSDKIGYLDVFDLVNLAEEGNTEELDTILTKYFRSNLRSIKNSLSKCHPHRRTIPNHAFRAHKRKEYFLSIPTFFIQADGMCYDLLGVQLFKKRGGKPVTAEEIQKIEARPFTAAFFEPLRIVLPISEDTRFLDAQGLHFNRHSILHGLSVTYGTETNSLKSISLVYFLDRLAHLYKKRS